jgi:hypothetical protein
MTSSHPTPALCQWFTRLASALDRRSVPRLALLFPQLIRMFDHASETVRFAEFSEDGKLIVTLFDEGNLRLWDVAVGPPQLIQAEPAAAKPTRLAS